MAVCGHCLPAYSLLQEDIGRLKQELRSKDELILGFSSVAAAQAKHLSAMGSSCCAGSFRECSAAGAPGEATLPWSGSVTTGGEPIISSNALNDDIWPILGAKPKSQACSTPCNAEPWVRVRSTKGRARRSLQQRASDTLQLSNKFQALDTGDGQHSPVRLQPVDHPSSARVSAPEPIGGPSTAMDCTTPAAARVQPPLRKDVPPGGSPDVSAAPPVSSPISTRAPHRSHRPLQQRHRGRPTFHYPPGRQLPTKSPPPSSSPPVPPAVLIVGSSMVRHVALPKAQTLCFPGARVLDIKVKLPSLLDKYPSASTVILHVGSNDIKAQQSEKLKKDFMSLIDTLLDSRAQCVISGPMPSPCWGDIKFSRLRNLHIWLKGYCRSLGLPFIDNFTTFLDRPALFRYDGLHLNWSGSRLLSTNMSLTINSCKSLCN